MIVVYKERAKRQDIILIKSVSSVLKSSVYPVQVVNLVEKDIWIKAYSSLGIVRKCVIEPHQDSQIIFLETVP